MPVKCETNLLSLINSSLVNIYMCPNIWCKVTAIWNVKFWNVMFTVIGNVKFWNVKFLHLTRRGNCQRRMLCLLNIHWALARTSVHHWAQLTAHSRVWLSGHFFFFCSLSVHRAQSAPYVVHPRGRVPRRDVMRTLMADTLQAYVPHAQVPHLCRTADAASSAPELVAPTPSHYGDKYLSAMNHNTEMCYFGIMICDADP